MTITRNEFITEWQKDLRSGEYIQGHRMLRTPEGNYCCLGVACETGLRLGITDASLETGVQSDEYLSPGEWFERLFGDTDPELTMDDEDEWGEPIQEPLSTLNDINEWSFNAIAEGLDQLREKE